MKIAKIEYGTTRDNGKSRRAFIVLYDGFRGLQADSYFLSKLLLLLSRARIPWASIFSGISHPNTTRLYFQTSPLLYDGQCRGVIIKAAEYKRITKVSI